MVRSARVAQNQKPQRQKEKGARRKNQGRLFLSKTSERQLPKIAKSSFCLGENNRNWRANLDWFLNPDTVTRIIEGQYDDGAAWTDLPSNVVIPEPGTPTVDEVNRAAWEKRMAARTAARGSRSRTFSFAMILTPIADISRRLADRAEEVCGMLSAGWPGLQEPMAGWRCLRKPRREPKGQSHWQPCRSMERLGAAGRPWGLA